jgi:integrase
MIREVPGVPESDQYGLPADLEDNWDDFRRSLARRNRSAGTMRSYRAFFVDFWRWALAAGVAPDPGAVDHRTINSWLDYLLARQVVRNGRPQFDVDPATGAQVPRLLSAESRKAAYRNVRPYFAWYAQEFETTNPFERADSPDGDKSAPVPVVAVEDLRRLLAACEGKDFEARRDTALIRVLIDTGARLGEMNNLTVDDWDRRIDVLALDGKTGRRGAPIGASTGEALSRYLRIRKSHPSAALPALWLGKRGRLGPTGMTQAIRRRCDQAKIPHINPHRFRHTWAHEFRAAGGSEGDLMVLAGWSSTMMAHRYRSSAAADGAVTAGRALSFGDRV